MYKIYCLVDPNTNAPFYVGVTKGKLRVRLSCHLQNVDYVVKNWKKRTLTYQRNELIYNILNDLKKPKIYLLFVTDKSSAAFMEKKCYEYLTNQGAELLQSSILFQYNPERKR